MDTPSFRHATSLSRIDHCFFKPFNQNAINTSSFYLFLKIEFLSHNFATETHEKRMKSAHQSRHRNAWNHTQYMHK